MDLNEKAIQNLERLKHLHQQKLTFQSEKRDTEMYNLLKQEILLRNRENVNIKNNIKKVLKNINTIQPIRISLDKDLSFARIAQGAKVSGSVLPSGLKMYHRIDNYEWVIRGNFAVLENQIG